MCPTVVMLCGSISRRKRAESRLAGLMICCPVTSQVKGYPFEVSVVGPMTSGVTGVVLADHVRSLDWRARSAVKFGFVDPQVTLDVGAKVKLLMP